jgi:hypothetical protein
MVGTAVNGHPVAAVVFAGDPGAGDAQRTAIVGEAALRAQGRGGNVYIGDKGAPERSYNGALATPQAFVGASTIAHKQLVYFDQQGRDIASGTVTEGPFADTTRRMFALRLARRSPM